MKKYIAGAVMCLIVLAALLSLSACGNTQEASLSAFVMDTTATVNVSGKNAERTAKKVINSAEKLDKDCLSRTARGSDIFKVNSHGRAEVSEKTAEVIRKALLLCEKSKGTLDIALGAVSDLWGVKTRTSPPAQEEINALISDPERAVHLNGDEVTLTGGAFIDLGSVGKGAACDEAKRILNILNAERATVSFGGSILFFGSGEFTVGIADPEKGSSDYIATVTTKQCFVSTSGTYERYFDYNGKRYHHIIDPATGAPVETDIVSVTVLANDGLMSDALSTACLVLGVEEGSKLAVECGAQAIFIKENGEMFCTDGVRSKIQITDQGYTLK